MRKAIIGLRREAKGREELDKELENKDKMEKTKKQEKPDVLKKTKQQEELNVMKNVMEREEKNPPNEDIFSNKAGKAMEFKKVGNLTMFPDRYLVALKRALAALKRALVINMIGGLARYSVHSTATVLYKILHHFLYMLDPHP